MARARRRVAQIHASRRWSACWHTTGSTYMKLSVFMLAIPPGIVPDNWLSSSPSHCSGCRPAMLLGMVPCVRACVSEKHCRHDPKSRHSAIRDARKGASAQSAPHADITSHLKRIVAQVDGRERCERGERVGDRPRESVRPEPQPRQRRRVAECRWHAPRQ